MRIAFPCIQTYAQNRKWNLPQLIDPDLSAGGSGVRLNKLAVNNLIEKEKIEVEVK